MINKVKQHNFLYENVRKILIKINNNNYYYSKRNIESNRRFIKSNK